MEAITAPARTKRRRCSRSRYPAAARRGEEAAEDGRACGLAGLAAYVGISWV